MKRSLFFTAIAFVLYHLASRLLAKEEKKAPPRQNHLTNAFSNAKRHAVNATAE